MQLTQAQHVFTRLSPYVRFVHYYRTGEAFRNDRRVIYDHLLLYTKEGYGWVGIERRRYRQAPGTLFFIKPRVLHSFLGDPGPDHLLMYNLHFDFIQQDDCARVPTFRGSVEETLAFPDQFRDDPTEHAAYALPEMIEHYCPDIYEQFFFEILNHAARADLASQLRVKAAMTGLLAHLYHFRDLHTTSRAANAAVTGLEGITRFMHEHLREPLTIEILAEQCHISKSYFSACFKEIYGDTPLHYLTRLRIDQACYALAQSDAPIKLLAEAPWFPHRALFHPCLHASGRSSARPLPPATVFASRGSDK